MDVLELFLSLLVLVSVPDWRSASETSYSSCLELDLERFNFIEGEAFYFVPYDLDDPDLPDEQFMWSKTSPEVENITTQEEDRIHHHGGALFFLNISAADSGLYTAKQITPSGNCVAHYVQLQVLNGTNREELNYGAIKDSSQNIEIPCPQPVHYTCYKFDGNFTWYKGTDLLRGQHKHNLWVKNATKEHEDIYSCVCTWRHLDQVYRSSGSRRLYVQEKRLHRPVEILSPTTKEQLADEGVGLKLTCKIFCGNNVKRKCDASWYVDGKAVEQRDRYNQTTQTDIEEPSKNTISTAVLNIERVSAKDFQREFKCFGAGYYTFNYVTLTLKKRESVIPLVIGGLCVFITSVFAAVLVKCFALDLALLFRPYFIPGRHKKDTRIYDAFVVYQTQNVDKDTENKVSGFVSTLPSVLEDKCGYRLFIQGRDDLPGEDHLELVDSCLKQSRRLMVILTPGSGSESDFSDKSPTSHQTSVIGSYDWQVGLHHALVNREMSVILIQLGDTGPQGFTHLPPGLQHLISESAPIRWPEDSQKAKAWNSRFWKRVRYLMPATPAKKRDPSAVV